MARKPAMTEAALAALGADKLARLVLDEAEQNPSFKRIVTAALAGTKGPQAIVAVVRRRLAALERARGFVDWQRRKAFTADLKATVAAITRELGPADPAAATEQLVRFLTTADAVFERVDDSSGLVQGVYWDAVDALPRLGERLDPGMKAALGEQLVPRLLADGYGLIERAFIALLPVLPIDAVERLDTILAHAQEPTAVRGRAESVHDRDFEQRLRADRIVRARQAIADRRGDVDAYIALAGQGLHRAPDTIGVAERLLAAGRAAEALEWIRRPARPGLRVMLRHDLSDASLGFDSAERERTRLEIRILEAMGERGDAQALRWKSFEDGLDAAMLRDYLAHLPDFEDFDALDRAFAHVAASPSRHAALAFLLAWPRLDLAARLVVEHQGEWDGGQYGLLAPAAEALEDTEPRAAAVLLYRALIDDILQRARSPAYGHAARYLARLDALAASGASVEPNAPDHDTYLRNLRQAHGRKAGF
jgi:hypothetical protein